MAVTSFMVRIGIQNASQVVHELEKVALKIWILLVNVWIALVFVLVSSFIGLTPNSAVIVSSWNFFLLSNIHLLLFIQYLGFVLAHSQFYDHPNIWRNLYIDLGAISPVIPSFLRFTLSFFKHARSLYHKPPTSPASKWWISF